MKNTAVMKSGHALTGAAHDPGRSFRFGLQRVIDGIEIFVRPASPPATE